MVCSPLISVIVPVYNVEKFLSRCIDSILAQKYKNFELLLINDGSKDASGQICDLYAEEDTRVRVFHKANGGVSSARNVGLDNARGEWITFCDSDDYVYPNWLDNFEVVRNKDCDLITQGMRVEYNPMDLKDIRNTNECDEKKSLIEIINILNNQGAFGYIFTKIFKKDIIESANSPIRFNRDYDFMEDEDFICRYLQRCKSVIYTQGVGYHYFLPNKYKYKVYSPNRIPLYLNLIDEVRKVSNGEMTEAEKKYQDTISVILVAECQKNVFSRECMLRLRDYVVKEFRHCPIILPTKIILALDPTGFFSALWLKLHLKIKKVDYTHS